MAKEIEREMRNDEEARRYAMLGGCGGTVARQR